MTRARSAWRRTSPGRDGGAVPGGLRRWKRWTDAEGVRWRATAGGDRGGRIRGCAHVRGARQAPAQHQGHHDLPERPPGHRVGLPARHRPPRNRQPQRHPAPQDLPALQARARDGDARPRHSRVGHGDIRGDRDELRTTRVRRPRHRHGRHLRGGQRGQTPKV